MSRLDLSPSTVAGSHQSQPSLREEPCHELSPDHAAVFSRSDCGHTRRTRIAGESPKVTLGVLSRHLRGDWGDLCQEDKAENELSLKHGFRLLSSYPITDNDTIWIITEADRSVTTLLLPSEY